MELSRKTLTIGFTATAMCAAVAIGFFTHSTDSGAGTVADVAPVVRRANPAHRTLASVPVELASLAVVEKATSSSGATPDLDDGRDGTRGNSSANGSAVGTLFIRLVGVDDLRKGSSPGAADVGPVIANLKSGVGFDETTTVLGEDVEFESVPMGADLVLELEYGEPANRSRISAHIDGPRAGARRTNLELDFGLRERNEQAAVATLRSIAAAQQQLQASASIDTDVDGGGEFGYFAEMAGVTEVRGYSARGQVMSEFKLDPTYLPEAFGNIQRAGTAGVTTRQGYIFQIFLPGPIVPGSTQVRGIAEAPDGGATFEFPDAALCETTWCRYAWPLEAHTLRHGAFFINQNGDVITVAGDSGNPYAGLLRGPSFDAALSVSGDMSSPMGLSGAGLSAADGNVWRPVSH